MRHDDALLRAQAGRCLIDAAYPHGGHYRNAAVNALGAAITGDARLADLTTCAVCGVMGDLGDVCGRAPEGHRLTSHQPSWKEEINGR